MSLTSSIKSNPTEYLKSMSVRTVLAQLLPGDEVEVVVECRHCGTTLSDNADECPECDSNEIGQYRISE